MTSSRRAARASAALDYAASQGVPRCLLVPLIEVWAPELASSPRHLSTLREAKVRRGAARRWWLAGQGISDHDGWSVVADGWPRSAAQLIADGREAQVRALLDRAGCTTADLKALASEAKQMYRTALAEARPPKRSGALT